MGKLEKYEGTPHFSQENICGGRLRWKKSRTTFSGDGIRSPVQKIAASRAQLDHQSHALALKTTSSQLVYFDKDMVECTMKTINVSRIAAAATNNCEVEISKCPTHVTDNITHGRSSRRASRSSTGLEMSGLLLTWTIILTEFIKCTFK
ncbi:hypothetical protein KSP40_PGU006049 [Platanthera guangdongensis]|uniref:Uncharacterized protein n=1 Tax=Platanthera guangdongensis TaxID=2320717 RepID=A0ABR2MSZ5_9ASPA